MSVPLPLLTRRRRALRVAALTALVAALAAGPPAVAAGTAPAVPVNAATGPTGPNRPTGAAAFGAHPATVTLVTGDRIQVSTGPDGRPNALWLRTAADRGRAVSITRLGGHLYVVPTDAEPLLRAGELDPALFDVNELVRDGYDDAHSSAMRVIATSASGPIGARAPLATSGRIAPEAPAHSTLTAKVPRLGLTGLKVDKRTARAFWDGVTGPGNVAPGTRAATLHPGIGKLWLDRRVRPLLDRSVPQIGAPAAYARGLDGTGVTVAVVDTGIDDQNPDVAPKVVAQKDFTGDGSTDDPVGHGTHVASIIAGSGAASNGKYTGVAPGVRLIDARVLGPDGGSESGVIAGLEWAAAQGARVINLSVGTLEPRLDGTDPASLAVNALTAQYGALFVVAAGNDGQDGERTVSSPAVADAALAVGAVDRDDTLAPFSGRGPRWGDDAIKPEITAPGVGIVAAQADGTQLGPVAAPGYVALSGTSMAAPHVAGAAALLRQQHPTWDAARIKAALVTTAKPTPNVSVWAQGGGRVDLAAATGTGGLAVDTATLNLGFFSWPHGGHPAVTRTLTYTNSTPNAVRLSLSTALTDDAGHGLPAGALTLSRSTLDLSAAGTGSVIVTLDPNKAGVGRWVGRITAGSGSGVTLSTPTGFATEAEHDDLTVKVLDRAGQPYPDATVYLYNPATGETHTSWELADPATATFRVSPGRWVATTTVAVDAPVLQYALVTQADYSVTGNQSLTLDARTTRPVGFTVPDPGLATMAINTDLRVSGPGQPFESGFGAGGDYFELYASPTQPLSTGSLTFTVRNTQVVPEITVDVVGATPTHLHPLIQRDGTGMVGAETRLDGTRTVRLTAAGGKVAGAFALVDVDDSTDLASTVAEVARAGAVGYVVYSSTSPGIRPPRPGSRTAVPGIELSKTEGIALARTLAHGDVRLSLVGTSRSPRVYDLERTWSGQIPQRPWTTYRTRDLARIDEVYRTLGKPGAAAVEATVDATSGGIAFPVPVGGSRVHYVSADVAWSHALLYGGDADDGGLWPAVAWVEPLIAYPAGRTTPKAWATPVIRPSADNQNDYNDLCRRAGDDAVIVVSPWGDGQGRYNDLSDGEFAWTLGSGGKTLASGDGPWIRATLPTARATYTLDFTGRATDPTWGLSTSTHSRWVFPSAHTDPKQPQPLPLLNLDTVLPLNAANTVPAGRPMTFTVNSRMPVGVSPLTVRALTVETSADGGRTWTPARSVARADQDTFTVTVTNPAQPGPVALRLSAVADGGIGVLQEVIAAYRVT